MPQKLQKPNPTWRSRRKRMAFEQLERRDMFAIISWVNRGTPINDTDGFNDLFGPRAELARGVVSAALETWENVIASFNYGDASLQDTYRMTVNANPTGTGLGANADPTAQFGGKPTAGTCSIGRGNNTVGDGRGDGDGWFLDPTPQEHSEFLDQLTNAFSSKGPAKGGPASEQADFYTILLHEFGHALGLTAKAQYRIRTSGMLTPITTGNPPTSVNDPNGAPGKLWQFVGPNVQHLMTSFDSGGASGSPSDFGFGIHSAFANTTTSATGTTFVGANDLMNPIFGFGERRLIPQTLALMLQDAYGYTIRPPADWPERPVTNSGVGVYGMNFYAMLNRSNGQLIVRGGGGNDVINITTNGTTNLTVSIDLGEDVAGTGSLPGAGNLPAFRMVFPTLAPITNILVLAGEGNDVIRIDALPRPLSVEGEGGNDQLILGWEAIPNLDTFTRDVVFNGGNGTDTFTIDDSANNQANRTYTLTSTGVLSGRVRLDTQGRNFDYSNVNFLNVRTGSGPLSTVTVRSNSVSQTTSIEGSARVVIGTGDVSNVLGRIQIVNATRATALTINDSLRNDTSQYDINPTNLRVIHGALQTVVTFNNAFLSSLTINGSRVQNQFNLRGTRSASNTFRVTLNTGVGNDVVDIGSTSTPVTINGQAGFDTINVGVSGVARTGGLLTITNSTGLTAVNVFDNDYTGKRTGILYKDSTTGNQILSGISGDISMRGRDISNLTVRAGNNGNIFRIHDTPKTTKLGNSTTTFFTGTGNDSISVTGTTGNLVIEGQNGSDAIVLGANGLYQNVKGKVTLTNQLGTNAVRVDNSADDLNQRTLILYKNPADGMNVLSGLNGADIVMRGDDLRSLSVSLGDFGNIVRVHDTPTSSKSPNLTTLINTGAGGDVAAINGTSGALTVETGNGTNDITVGSTTTALDSIQGTVNVKGFGTSTNLIIQDRATTSDRALMHIVTPTRYIRDGIAPVLYSELAKLSILGGNAADIFDVAAIVGSALAQRILIDGGGSVNALDYSKIPAVGGSGPPPVDQISLYTADNSFADAKATNNGTPVNGVSFALGRRGQAFAFDGVDDFIDLGTNESLNLTQSVTFAAWVNTESVLTYKYLIADFDQGGTRSQAALGLLGEQLFWYQTMADGTTIQPESVTSLVAGQWFHVAGVRDGVAKTITLYINGVADKVESYAGDIVPLQGHKLLGTSLPTGFPNDFFQGRMDDVSIFNRALSSAEILNLYGPGPNGPAPGVVVNLALGSATGLTGGIRNIQTVFGGGGNDILVGTGSNQLIGGLGMDLIIAGTTASLLIGSGDRDILIGGTTAFDRNAAILDSILSEWVNSGTTSRLTTANVVKNNSLNRLSGDAERDWFFAALANELVDFSANEDQWTVL